MHQMEQEYLQSLQSNKKSQYNSSEAGLEPVYLIAPKQCWHKFQEFQKNLGKKNIPVRYQEETDRLLRIPGSKQETFFLVLYGIQKQTLKGEFKKLTFECQSFEFTGQQEIIDKHKIFFHKGSINQNSSNTMPKGAEQIGLCSTITQNLQNPPRKSKITLNSVSKILRTYKSGWPIKLFIYSNKHDDEQYSDLLNQIKENSFDNAVNIRQIEDYIKCLPQKGDRKFTVLMSQYSAINLRKYFKGTDQILLLGFEESQCLPLIRGKVSFLTTQPQIMISYLKKNFGMKQKVIPIQQKQSQSNELKPSVTTKEQSEEKVCSSQLRRSSQNMEISPQFSMVNESSKILRHSSQIMTAVYCSQLIPAFQVKPECQVVEDQEQWMKMIEMDKKQITNVEHQSSELISSHLDFGELMNLPVVQDEKARNNIDLQQLESRQVLKQNVPTIGPSGFKSQRSSINSHASRIFNRFKERAGINKRRINLNSH